MLPSCFAVVDPLRSGGEFCRIVTGEREENRKKETSLVILPGYDIMDEICPFWEPYLWEEV